MAINKAFKDWEAVHSAYLESERQLADAETVFSFTRTQEPIELRREVARKRAESDRLLQAAMQLLHSRMSGSRAP